MLQSPGQDPNTLTSHYNLHHTTMKIHGDLLESTMMMRMVTGMTLVMNIGLPHRGMYIHYKIEGRHFWLAWGDDQDMVFVWYL